MDDVAPDRPLGHRGSPFAPYEVDVRAVGPGRPDDRMAVAEAEALAEAAVEVGSPEVGTPQETSHPVDTEPVWPGRPADGRSPYVTTCPFFRAQAPDGTLLPPIEAGDPNNRCAAFGEPQPQSRRQQELVCLESGHINCPRYLRGALIASKSQSPRRTLTRATLIAIALLVLSAGASFAFVLVRGGLNGKASNPGPAAAVAIPTPRSAATPSLAAVATPSPPARPTPSPTPARPSPTPTSTPSATPAASSDRYALLTPCPTKPDCYLYTVRRGDNLSAIAHYFGTTLDAVRLLNPWTQTKGISPGDKLILPPPTR
ncbi:MAG: LysM peptidoglycan-binding domain-containing protein [Chloroflexota bacterium]|nr:LysM peptidoglycan-binding domain-containing protein [Chloroflexota bacterium]